MEIFVMNGIECGGRYKERGRVSSNHGDI